MRVTTAWYRLTSRAVLLSDLQASFINIKVKCHTQALLPGCMEPLGLLSLCLTLGTAFETLDALGFHPLL